MKTRSSIPNVNGSSAAPKSRKSYGEAPFSRATKTKIAASSSEETQRSINQILIESPLPSQEEIAIRARIIWEQEGQPIGRDEEIWLRAENELKDELNASCSQ